ARRERDAPPTRRRRLEDPDGEGPSRITPARGPELRAGSGSPRSVATGSPRIRRNPLPQGSSSMDNFETPLTPLDRRTLAERPLGGEPTESDPHSRASVSGFDLSSLGESELRIIRAIDTPEIEC